MNSLVPSAARPGWRPADGSAASSRQPRAVGFPPPGPAHSQAPRSVDSVPSRSRPSPGLQRGCLCLWSVGFALVRAGARTALGWGVKTHRRQRRRLPRTSLSTRRPSHSVTGQAFFKGTYPNSSRTLGGPDPPFLAVVSLSCAAEVRGDCLLPLSSSFSTKRPASPQADPHSCTGRGSSRGGVWERLPGSLVPGLRGHTPGEIRDLLYARGRELGVPPSMNPDHLLWDVNKDTWQQCQTPLGTHPVHPTVLQPSELLWGCAPGA